MWSRDNLASSLCLNALNWNNVFVMMTKIRFCLIICKADEGISPQFKAMRWLLTVAVPYQQHVLFICCPLWLELHNCSPECYYFFTHARMYVSDVVQY